MTWLLCHAASCLVAHQTKAQTMGYFTTQLLYNHNSESSSGDCKLEQPVFTYPPRFFVVLNDLKHTVRRHTYRVLLRLYLQVFLTCNRQLWHHPSYASTKSLWRFCAPETFQRWGSDFDGDSNMLFTAFTSTKSHCPVCSSLSAIGAAASSQLTSADYNR